MGSKKSEKILKNLLFSKKINIFAMIYKNIINNVKKDNSSIKKYPLLSS